MIKTLLTLCIGLGELLTLAALPLPLMPGKNMEPDFAPPQLPPLIRHAELEFHPPASGFPVVLNGSQRKFRSPWLSCRLPAGTRAGALYLLHALENCYFGDIGTIRVTFSDGTRQLIRVSATEECGDWQNARQRKHAPVAWRNDTRRDVGFYAAGWKLDRDDPTEIVFEVTARKSRWLIAAATLTTEFRPTADENYVINAGDEYIPIQYKWNTVPGSPLDFSDLNDAPAGKYGFVRRRGDGTFCFEKTPEKRIRFFGQNIVYHCNFPTRKDAVRIADELARTGCNLVRFHLNDDLMLKENARNSLDLDPSRLDAMEYFFARLKERGIYVTVDLYGCRHFRVDDGPELAAESAPMSMKFVYLLERSALDNLKSFAKMWLTHVNPYTGLAWKDDPALAFVNLINEDGVESVWQRSPTYRERFLAGFREATGREPFTSPSSNQLSPEFRAWLEKIQDGQLTELRNWARGELGLRQLISSINSEYRYGYVPLRDKLDFVDNHTYYAHPQYSPNYRLPWKFGVLSSIENFATVPAWIFPTRLFGRPFTVTEFNFCHPNMFRAEGGPLLAAYASLQNWDALVNYRWASDYGPQEIDGNYRIACFSANSDPLLLCTNRLISRVFRREMIRKAPERFAIIVPDSIDQAVRLHYPEKILRLGLITQVGSILEKDQKEAVIPSFENVTDPRITGLFKRLEKEGIAESSTGELELNADKQTFRVAAPLVSMAVLREGSLAAGVLKVEDADSFQTLALLALDNLPLTESRKMLLFHLTDVTNTGITFEDGTRRVLKAHGTLPLLLRRGRCRIQLTGRHGLTVNALGLDGQTRGAIPVRESAGGSEFELDNKVFGGTFNYCIQTSVSR